LSLTWVISHLVTLISHATGIVAAAVFPFVLLRLPAAIERYLALPGKFLHAYYDFQDDLVTRRRKHRRIVCDEDQGYRRSAQKADSSVGQIANARSAKRIQKMIVAARSDSNVAGG
jgi:hypothetical protein